MPIRWYLEQRSFRMTSETERKKWQFPAKSANSAGQVRELLDNSACIGRSEAIASLVFPIEIVSDSGLVIEPGADLALAGSSSKTTP